MMDDIKDKILETLSLLDSMDDDHWTNDGAPKVDVVAELGDIEVKRADIINAAPEFSRDNPSLDQPKSEIVEEPSYEENSLGYKHPTIIKAQEEYDVAVAALAAAKAEETAKGDVLTKAINRLMSAKEDKQKNQRGIMAVIEASKAARVQRVQDYNISRALMKGTGAPRSPLDNAKAGEKKVRPKMS